MKKLLLLLIILLHQNLFAQDKIFTLEEFINQVKQFHPLAKQANIQVDKAKADLLSSKGLFDPTITFEASRKTLDGKNYYNYLNPELKVPLPVGDIKTGLENNGGANISSELTPGQSSYLGAEIPLAKGLLFDKRRAAVQQAKIFVNQSQQTKLILLNDLLYDAYLTYGNWAVAYKLYKIYNNYVKISSDRLRLVKIAFKNGDRSGMDTLEAFTQLQNFEMMQTNALMNVNNAVYDINNFLWQQNDSAIQLKQNVVPNENELVQLYDKTNVEDIVGNSLRINPNIASYNFKIEALNVERKLKFQNLLPTINAKANILNKDYAVLNRVNGAFIENNYKWGIDFKLPIFLREGRGEYRKAKLKIAETNFELNNKKVQVENKIRTYFNEYDLQLKQFSTAQNAFNNFNSLYRNELLRFTNGESSLFLVNSRENKAIEMLQKTTELEFKVFKARYSIDWAAGNLR